MAKQRIIFGEWLPDQPGVTGALTGAVNCYPVTNGYAPILDEEEYSDAADADLLTCFAGKTAGVVSLFGASASNLYKFEAGTRAMDPLTTAGYSAIEYWDVVQYGEKMIMANGTDKLQSFTLNSSTYAGDLAAAAPEAKYVTVVKDFVVAANVAGEENKVYWSDINDETDWTPSLASQSDSQVMPDGGDITGLAGGEFGIVFMERAIYRMTYAGSPYFFQFDAISRTLGCISPGSVINYSGLTYFLADDGFYVCDGQSAKPIGAEKVDRWFFDRVNSVSLKNGISSAVDPEKRIIIWLFPNQSGANTLLIYNILLGKWSYAETTANSISSAMTPSVTLEDLDGFSASIDALTISLDDRQWAGGQLLLAGTSGAKIITFSGAYKQAALTSGDIDIGHSVVTLGRPIVDAGSGSVAVASRELLDDAITFGTASVADSEGRCGLRSAGRYHRVKTSPSGAWRTAVAVEVDISGQGSR
jgi:hypothetical protein